MMNHFYQWNETDIIGYQMTETRILAVVQGGISVLQYFFYIIRHKKRGAVAQVFVELGEINMNTGQVEITKMKIGIRDGQQPVTQIFRLGITRYKEYFPGFEQIPLTVKLTKVISIFHPDYKHVGRNTEPFRFLHKTGHAFHRRKGESLFSHHHFQRFTAIHQKTTEGP